MRSEKLPCARDLIVIQLHRINGAAAEFVILRVRSENRAEQDASLTALGMSFHVICFERNSGRRIFAVT